MYMEPIDARGLCPLLSARPIISSSAVLGPCDAIKKDMEAHVIHAPGVQVLVGLGDRGYSWLLATLPPSPQPSRPSARLVASAPQNGGSFSCLATSSMMVRGVAMQIPGNCMLCLPTEPVPVCHSKHVPNACFCKTIRCTSEGAEPRRLPSKSPQPEMTMMPLSIPLLSKCSCKMTASATERT